MQYGEVKGILQSRAVWSAIVGLIAMGLQVFNLGDALGDSAAQAKLVDNVLQFIQAGGFVAAAVFRILAKARIN